MINNLGYKDVVLDFFKVGYVEAGVMLDMQPTIAHTRLIFLWLNRKTP